MTDKLSAEEIATNIWRSVHSSVSKAARFQEVVNQIKSVETAAREEGHKDGFLDGLSQGSQRELIRMGYRTGQREMREKAELIIIMHPADCLNRIRALPIDSGEKES